MKSKLILIDGMPGSGKSTLAGLVAEHLNLQSVPTRCILELEPNHPLFIHDRKFTSFEDHEQASWFSQRVRQLFSDFVKPALETGHVVIIESAVL